jgi:transcriptional regulator with XRE-family HTH domain
MLVTQRMIDLLAAHMEAEGITQAELARRTGRSTKHINQVFQGKAGTGEIDYWAFVLGFKFHVSLVPLEAT